MVKYWTTPADLAGAVALSLIQTRKTRPAEGWIRACNALTPEVEREMAELRERVATLTKDLEVARGQGHVRDVDVAALAQGDDTYGLPIRVRYWTEKDVKKGETYPSRAKWHYAHVESTWDEIFSRLAPLLRVRLRKRGWTRSWTSLPMLTLWTIPRCLTMRAPGTRLTRVCGDR
jgi:hypothetical protein